MSRLLRVTAPSLLCLFLLPAVSGGQGRLPAQEIEFTPRADRPVERRLDDFLEARRYRLISADTVLRDAGERYDALSQGVRETQAADN